MRLHYIYILFFFVFVACEPVFEGKVDQHFDKAKHEYIATKYGDVKIKLGPCFEKINDYHFSLTNEHRYQCEMFNLYFSLDVLSTADAERLSSEEITNIPQLLEYLAKLRAGEFYDISTGVPSKVNHSQFPNHYQLFQYGKWGNQNEELIFWASAILEKDKFYLIQFICIKADLHLYEKHFKNAINSFQGL